MKKTVSFLGVAAVLAGAGVGCGATGKGTVKPDNAEVKPAATIKLPAPRLDRAAPLMQALKDRRSERSYSDRRLSMEQLADILWAANGINRGDGKRTSPSAMNRQGVDIYAVTADGVFLYDAAKHALVAVATGDFRKDLGEQEFVAFAALNLAFVADTDVIGVDGAAIAVGCMAQNVALYCATEGLGNVVRGWFEPQKVSKVLVLKPNQKVILTQTVGYPKEPAPPPASKP
jgi:nitroreductase